MQNVILTANVIHILKGDECKKQTLLKKQETKVYNRLH